MRMVGLLGKESNSLLKTYKLEERLLAVFKEQKVKQPQNFGQPALFNESSPDDISEKMN